MAAELKLPGRHRANVARAISRFEPVVMLANDADLVAARTLCGPVIEVRRVAIDDGWFRDNGPTFALDGLGSLLGIDWDFNGWGGRFPSVNDRMAAAAILDQEVSSGSLRRWYWKVDPSMSMGKARSSLPRSASLIPIAIRSWTARRSKGICGIFSASRR